MSHLKQNINFDFLCFKTGCYFLTGFFIGCSSACLAAFIILVRLNWFNVSSSRYDAAKSIYMTSIFPVFRYKLFDLLFSLTGKIYYCLSFRLFSLLLLILCSIMAMIVLHLYMYGLNLFIWREKRINYAFIFEFSINTELKHREVLLVASGLTTLVVGGLLGHFMAYTNFTTSNTAIIPLVIILVCLPIFNVSVLFLGFNER